MEIISPGRLYGGTTLKNLGEGYSDPRNRFLMAVLEHSGIVENRHQGIRIMKDALAEYGMEAPLFEQKDDSFIVTFRKERKVGGTEKMNGYDGTTPTDPLVEYMRVPRTRREIADFLGLESQTYAIRTYITPLVEKGEVELSVPDHPRSIHQTYRYRD